MHTYNQNLRNLRYLKGCTLILIVLCVVWHSYMNLMCVYLFIFKMLFGHRKKIETTIDINYTELVFLLNFFYFLLYKKLKTKTPFLSFYYIVTCLFFSALVIVITILYYNYFIIKLRYVFFFVRLSYLIGEILIIQDTVKRLSRNPS